MVRYFFIELERILAEVLETKIPGLTGVTPDEKVAGGTEITFSRNQPDTEPPGSGRPAHAPDAWTTCAGHGLRRGALFAAATALLYQSTWAPNLNIRPTSVAVGDNQLAP
jgi:hypothetical protein